MSKSSIQKDHVQKLWRLASHRCSFYDCKTELVKEEKEGVLGNMAHIVAESENGYRGRSELTLKERNSYANLILLCPYHHSLIDNNEQEWSVEKLYAMKQDHENWVRTQLSKGETWHSHIHPKHLHYINLARLALDPSAYSYLSSWDDGYRFDTIKNLCEVGLVELAQIRQLVKLLLQDWQPATLSLNNISCENVGTRINFETEFRTKNVPGPDKLSSFKLKGNIQKDPHIYCWIGERKIYITINPRWIVADTAFSLFKSGRITLSGLGILNIVQEKEARITPLVIAAPDYPGSEYF